MTPPSGFSLFGVAVATWRGRAFWWCLLMYPSSMCTYEEFQGCRDSFWTHSYNSNTILAPPLRQELTQLFFMGGGGGSRGWPGGNQKLEKVKFLEFLSSLLWSMTTKIKNEKCKVTSSYFDLSVDGRRVCGVYIAQCNCHIKLKRVFFVVVSRNWWTIMGTRGSTTEPTKC